MNRTLRDWIRSAQKERPMIKCRCKYCRPGKEDNEDTYHCKGEPGRLFIEESIYGSALKHKGSDFALARNLSPMVHERASHAYEEDQKQPEKKRWIKGLPPKGWHWIVEKTDIMEIK